MLDLHSTIDRATKTVQTPIISSTDRAANPRLRARHTDTEQALVQG